LDKFYAFLFLNNYSLFKFFVEYIHVDNEYIKVKNNVKLQNDIIEDNDDSSKSLQSLEFIRDDYILQINRINKYIGITNENKCYNLYQEYTGHKIIHRQSKCSKRFQLDNHYIVNIKGLIDGIDEYNNLITTINLLLLLFLYCLACMLDVEYSGDFCHWGDGHRQEFAV